MTVFWRPVDMEPDGSGHQTEIFASTKVNFDPRAGHDLVNELLAGGVEALIDNADSPIARIELQIGQDRTKTLPNKNDSEPGIKSKIAGPRVLFQWKVGSYGQGPTSAEKVQINGRRYASTTPLAATPIIRTAYNLRTQVPKA